MNHCIGVPAAELRVDSTQASCATEKAGVAAVPFLPDLRAPVFLHDVVASVFVFTGRMKAAAGLVRLQGASCPFCLR